MPERAFNVKYDGPALADRRMPVRDLAPALLALGDLFTRTGKALNPDAPPVALKIEATREGSFVVDLVLQGADGPWDQMAGLASSVDIDELGKLLWTIFTVSGGVAGVIDCIKFLKGQLPASREPLEGGLVRLTDADGHSITVRAEVEVLAQDTGVRKSARAVVEPLSREGVERVDFQVDSEVVTSVAKQDVSAFALPSAKAVDEDEPNEQFIRGALVEIVQPTITGDDYKWRLTMGDGSSPFMATIEDETYIRRILTHEQPFLAGDRLRCTLRIVQTESAGKLATEYAVTEVTEHIQAEPQIPFEDAGEAA